MVYKLEKDVNIIEYFNRLKTDTRMKNDEKERYLYINRTFRKDKIRIINVLSNAKEK